MTAGSAHTGRWLCQIMSCQRGLPQPPGRTGSKGAVGWHSLRYFSVSHTITQESARPDAQTHTRCYFDSGKRQMERPPSRVSFATSSRGVGLQQRGTTRGSSEETMAPAQRKATTRDWPFQVRPLHPSLGCEISGITLAEAVEPKLFDNVYETFLDYELILFRDVDLPPAMQVAFARAFGEVQIHVMNQYHGYKDFPEIYMLSNLGEDGKPSGKHPDRGTLFWHTDGSWRERTGQATMMYSEIVPPEGGETEFADMYAAYDNLSSEMKQRIAGK